MYPGFDGFLGTRASFMLDVVFLAMFVIVPALVWSVYLVKVKRRYALHKRLQVMLGSVLLVAVTLFEIDMRWHGWVLRAADSPYSADGTVQYVLWVHLCFAVSTALLWVVVMYRALKNMPSPPSPCPHSVWHKRWGWIAAIDMLLTSITGWAFYWLAFAAK
jgi:putative membrane protein